MPVWISNRSRKPSVVMNAVFARLPSMIALVATVVPWTTYRIDSGLTRIAIEHAIHHVEKSHRWDRSA